MRIFMIRSSGNGLYEVGVAGVTRIEAAIEENKAYCVHFNKDYEERYSSEGPLLVKIKLFDVIAVYYTED